MPVGSEEAVSMPKVTFLFPPPGGWTEAAFLMSLGF